MAKQEGVISGIFIQIVSLTVSPLVLQESRAPSTFVYLHFLNIISFNLEPPFMRPALFHNSGVETLHLCSRNYCLQ